MRYGSVCSGIEAATVAWHPLGWEPAFYSEIEAFPSTVLHEHYGCGRPMFLPDPDAEGLSAEDRKEMIANIKACQRIPEVINPTTPNLGDMTRFKEWPDYAIELLVGGTPCQGFSVAGFRKGLDDPRSNLMLTYLALAAKHRPKWLVWENVPGALSTNGGRDFGALLWGLGQLGYGYAYRVLDAQFCRALGLPFAVPQRRRRLFVVGYLGDWRRAAAVLFDGASLRGDSPPRREAGQRAAGTLSASAARRGGVSEGERGGLVPEVAGTLNAGGNTTGGDRQPGTTADTAATMLIPQGFGGNNTQGPIDVATARLAHGGPTGHLDFESETFVAQPVSFDHLAGGNTGFAIGEDVAGTVRVSGNAVGHQSVAIPFDTTQITHPENRSNPQPGDPAGTLPKAGHAPAFAFQPRFARNDRGGPEEEVVPPLTAQAGQTGKGDSATVVAYGIRNDATREGVALTPSPDAEGKVRLRNPGMGISEELAPTMDAGQPHAVAFNITPSNSNEDYKARETEHAMALTSASGKQPSSRGGTVVQTAWRVRRLTPVECERLQGFPDGYTQVKYRGKASADGPRYKALGNSMATNVMQVLGERIAIVDAIE